ncbi:MAG: hypothetical protein GQ526_00365 [Ardenticatenales bacterium]|nr:hypothetical protein [Ardenticatenales bacterium]
MKTRALEPGLLAVFRRFIILELGIFVLAAVAFPNLGEWSGAHLLLWISPLCLVLIQVYLSSPWFQQKTGRMFLPMALAAGSLVPILGQSAIMAGFGARLVGSSAGTTWRLFTTLFIPLFLLVPLVLISWQYGMGAVLLFCGGTALLDLVAGALSAGDGLRVAPFLASAVTRTAIYLIVGNIVVQLMAQQRAQRESLARANRQLAHYATTLEQLAVSRERNRLARELHDTLAHTLSGLSVQLEAVKALWDSNPKGARSTLVGSLAAAREGLTETRRALRDLRASPLEDLGLALALCNLAESVATRTGLELELEVPEQLDELPPNVGQCIYRTAQEALANVDQHAEARRVRVALHQGSEQVVLTISDDGSGFDPRRVDPESQFGIQGMRERAEMVDGVLEVKSQPGKGTMVRFTVET